MPALKDLSNGSYFKRKEGAKAVYIRGDFDRASKTYSCVSFDDMNKEIFLKGQTNVFTDFEF